MKDIAKKLGVSSTTLKRFLIRMNAYAYLRLKRTAGGHYRFTEDDLNKIDFLMTQEGARAHPETRLRKRRPQKW